MIIDINKQDLIQMIYNTYNDTEGYDMSELKTETILWNYEDDDETIVKFDNIFDDIKFRTSLYYFRDFPGKLNIKDFENDFGDNHTWEEYKKDCEEYGLEPDKIDWYEELCQSIPEGAYIAKWGIVVNH